MQYQGGIPPLPSYDPKILKNAPPELMRGMSYPNPEGEHYLQGQYDKIGNLQHAIERDL